MKARAAKFLESKIFAEIGASSVRVVDEGFCCAREEHFSFLKEIRAVDDRKNFSGVVVGDEDADLFVLEDADEVFDVGDGDGVDVGEGFVKEKERGLGDEGAGDFETASFSAGKARGEFGAEVIEMEFFEKFVKARFGIFNRERF